VSESGLSVHAHVAPAEGSPYEIPSRKLTMWLFLISDAVTFGVFLYVYGYIRLATPDWKRPFGTGSVINVMIMTFILLTSSLTMLGAVEASKSGEKGKTMRFMASTVALGLVFAALHLREWFGMFSQNITLGSGLFGQTFFTITGLHLLHVIGGLIALVIVARGYWRDSLTPGHVESTGLYWHFVDLVWMFVVPLVYLTNIAR
jgi:cytochrome c oxidase subunit III